VPAEKVVLEILNPAMGYCVPMAMLASELALEKWVAEDPVLEPKDSHV